MVVANGLVPVWHQGIGSNTDLYVLLSYQTKAFLCDIFYHYVWICSHLVKPCLIHVESVSSWFGGLGLASGPLNTSGLDFKFSLRNELTQNTTEYRVIDLARNFTRHIFVSTQTAISVSPIAVVWNYGQHCLYIRYNVVICRVLVIWRHYNDRTDIFWLSGNSSLPAGTWVSWIVINALNIVTRYEVYSLLSFCNGSCGCVNNFIWFSGKTLF